MNLPEKRWLKAEEAAAYLGKAKGTVYNLISQGLLPYSKRKGIGLRIDRKRIDEMLEEAEVLPIAEQLEEQIK